MISQTVMVKQLFNCFVSITMVVSDVVDWALSTN